LLGFLQPIWLLGMAGIIAPVVIHLWNSKQGKVLAIGSIDFLDKTSLRKARSRQISDWWLLLVRCLLLILLALFLAGPVWRRQTDGGKKGWVLVGNANTTDAKQVDSLTKAGFQRHDLEDSSWWAAFSRLDRQAPSGTPFYVFTDGLLQHFSGNRPATGRPVFWHVSEPGDSATQWVEAAWRMGQDSMSVITGATSAAGTTFTYRVNARDATTVDTTALQVVVHTDDKYVRDGQWVTGAVKALQQFTRRNIVISSRLGDATNWLFWLSSQPLPADVKASNILLYEAGPVTSVDTWIRGSDIPVVKEAGQSSRWIPVWADGFGRPLLAMEETDGGRRYHYFSHFDPLWNGLVWSGEFPIRMEELLLDQPANAPDRRAIDPAQVAPSEVDIGQQATQATDFTTDLSSVTWLMIFLTLMAERILSFKKEKDG
jgi:hypothetical protein